MSSFDSLPSASFGGVIFPITNLVVKGAQRYHEHEYPHTPGAALEVMGRKLYHVSMDGLFHSTFPQYPGLFPQALSDMRAFCEHGDPLPLVIPTIGTITAVIVGWDERATAKQRSGVTVAIEFIEQQTSEFIFQSIVGTAAQTFESAAAVLVEAMAEAEEATAPDLSEERKTYAGKRASALGMFDQLRTTLESVAAIRDTFDMYGALAIAKIEGFIAACERADRTVSMLNDPSFLHLLEALHDAWAGAVALAQNVQSKQGLLATYIVPRTQPLASISTTLYGDATHIADLLQMNPIQNGYAVPAGTPIRYYHQVA